MIFFWGVFWSHIPDTTLGSLCLCNNNTYGKYKIYPVKVCKTFGYMLLQVLQLWMLCGFFCLFFLKYLEVTTWNQDKRRMERCSLVVTDRSSTLIVSTQCLGLFLLTSWMMCSFICLMLHFSTKYIAKPIFLMAIHTQYI